MDAAFRARRRSCSLLFGYHASGRRHGAEHYSRNFANATEIEFHREERTRRICKLVLSWVGISGVNPRLRSGNDTVDPPTGPIPPSQICCNGRRGRKSGWRTHEQHT